MKKYILIADPLKVSRFVLEQYLSEKYNLLMAESLSEAKRMLSMAIPSIVLVAYEMKDGLGLELARFISEKYKNVPVIIMSAEDNTERKKLALESGAIDYIVRRHIDKSIIHYIDEIIELLDISNLRGTSGYVLIINPIDAKLAINILNSLGMQVIVPEEEIIPENIEKEFTSISPDIIIIDIDYGYDKVLEIVKSIRKLEKLKKVPILLLTDSMENSALRSFILFGANDYTLKPISNESFILRVTTNIRAKKLYDYLESINTELYKLATTDPLTGLYNRRFILEQLTMLNYNFERYGHNFTIMIMDIDKFKSINDTYGHDAGDMVIIDFANRVKESLRKTDYVGRFGGEELIVILQHINEENSISLTRKILETLRKSEVKYGEFTIRYTASIGVKYCNLYFEKIDEYIKKADQLLYMAKEKGRNRAFVDTGINVMEVV